MLASSDVVLGSAKFTASKIRQLMKMALDGSPLVLNFMWSIQQSGRGDLRFIGDLELETGRQVCDVDVYLAGPNAPSYGWHVDSVDNLVVCVKGKKNFRIAGHSPGSQVAYDGILEVGDAVYVPAHAFHNGKGTDGGASIILSVGLGRAAANGSCTVTQGSYSADEHLDDRAVNFCNDAQIPEDVSRCKSIVERVAQLNADLKAGKHVAPSVSARESSGCSENCDDEILIEEERELAEISAHVHDEHERVRREQAAQQRLESKLQLLDKHYKLAQSRVGAMVALSGQRFDALEPGALDSSHPGRAWERIGIASLLASVASFMRAIGLVYRLRSPRVKGRSL